MRVIDRDTVKTYLGISDSSQDVAIDAMIPIIDAKVKMICHNNFNKQFTCKLTSGSVLVEVYGAGYNTRNYRRGWPVPELEQLLKELPVGTMLEGTGIASGAYIDEIYYNGVNAGGINIPTFKLSANATASDDSAEIYAGINIAYQQTIAKGVQWLINQQTTSINDDNWKSKKVGPLSVTKGDGSERIDGKSGMPAWFVRALPRYMS